MSAGVAAVWWPQAQAESSEERRRWLYNFSPFVGPSSLHPGLFFLAATGLEGLFASQAGWAEALALALHARNEQSTLALGWHERALWARLCAAEHASSLAGRARARPLVVTLPSPADPASEQVAAGRAPLVALRLPADDVQKAQALRLSTLQQICALPRPSVAPRLGAALASWSEAMARPPPPLSRAVPAPPVVAESDLLDACDNADRLLFVAKRLLAEVLAIARRRRELLTALHLHVRYEGRSPPPPLLRRIEAAKPSCDEPQWLELIRLSLGYTVLAAPATAIKLQAELVVAAPPEQLQLWPAACPVRARAACHALAKVQSAWGQAAVTIAELQDSHLPEEQFVWRRWRGEALPAAKPRATRTDLPGGQSRPPRVRLVWQASRPLPAALRKERCGAPQAQSSAGLWQRGPFVFNLYWWAQEPCDRDYWYVRRRPGEPVFWLFFDRRRRQWRWQGMLD